MFDLINGIPLHPLVVHAVVVLLPLAVLGTIAIALRPSWRVRYGPLVVAAAAVVDGAHPGGDLQRRGAREAGRRPGQARSSWATS